MLFQEFRVPEDPKLYHVVHDGVDTVLSRLHNFPVWAIKQARDNFESFLQSLTTDEYRSALIASVLAKYGGSTEYVDAETLGVVKRHDYDLVSANS